MTKYNTSGSCLWASSIGSTFNSSYSSKMGSDGYGNSYVLWTTEIDIIYNSTTITNASLTPMGSFLLKIDPDGILVNFAEVTNCYAVTMVTNQNKVYAELKYECPYRKTEVYVNYELMFEFSEIGKQGSAIIEFDEAFIPTLRGHSEYNFP